MYLKTIMVYVPLPFLIGVVLGWLYPSAGPVSQDRIVGGITGFGNPYVFDLFAVAAVAIVSLYVLIKGPITSSVSSWEKRLIYWPPATALGFVVPFFAALYGFIASHPPSDDLRALSIMGLVGFIWSAGFLILLLLPAHAGICPVAQKDKRLLYGAVLFSTIIAAVWSHIT
ncbi:hypothetical protein [Marinobacter nauticus]|uniref:hypothetical protein n=1 Tax=Marinobacter nauticus TaxID=2743 RepID=UPI0037366489